MNAYVLDELAFPQLHAQKKSKKRDFLSFRLDVAMGLVSSFHSRKRTGHPRSGEYSDIQRMDLQRGHWPVGIKRKAECVVCSKKRAKLHLQQSDCRHESRVICSYCDVHLCIDEDRKCFMNITLTYSIGCKIYYTILYTTTYIENFIHLYIICIYIQCSLYTFTLFIILHDAHLYYYKGQ